ncbi:MAG: divergent PAP2 family protein [Spirochaetes bacterium]|nr:divergent PAP2 family protein [Spirochaetota bacterium]
MNELLTNKTFIASFLAVVTAQIFKVIINLLLTKEINVKDGLGTGGMPSSHSAAVAAISTCVGILHGTGSTFFAVTLVLSLVVISDAVGIRRAAGKHAEVLNEWSKIFSESFEHGFKPEDLRTLLGHTYPQVFAGILLGCTSGALVAVYL